MSRSKYRESRTLVRRLCRLPGESRAEFKAKVARLREHFERFNTDVSDLCQWLMGLRRIAGDRNRPESFGLLGDFILDPGWDHGVLDEATADRWRLAVWDAAFGFRNEPTVRGQTLPEHLLSALRQAARHAPHTDEGNSNARRLTARLGRLQPAHRLVLYKAAAEWVVARYLRGLQNWVRQHAEWVKEKQEWEAAHPALTPEVRERFTAVFRSLRDPERDGRPGLRRKRPRICPAYRLAENIDNCVYAGQKGHAPLCWKYSEFLKENEKRNRSFNKKRFSEDIKRLIALCVANRTRPSKFFLSPRAPDTIFKDNEPGKRPRLFQRLKDNWSAYLDHMNLTEDTILLRQRLPHCTTLGDLWEKSRCECNPHTELCLEYKRALASLPEEVRALEGVYRDWRALYLAGPRKPEFRYPSSRDLPMPKIFGDEFFEVDMSNSVLRLRLDDMAKGEWVEFGFVPWPRGYTPSRDDVHVTSIHMNFIGTRARAGFRFAVPHRQGRFTCSQDQIDELRSQRFPRQAQDQEFLDAARTLLLDSFRAGAAAARQSLRVLSVDVGMTGAACAVYEGSRHVTDEVLPIIKADRLYVGTTRPPAPGPGGKVPPTPPGLLVVGDGDTRGLRREHVGRHLAAVARGAAAVAERRQAHSEAQSTIRDSDFRGLKRHVAWMIRDWVRLNAAAIVRAAEKHECDVIVFESLRGKRQPTYDKLGDESERKKQEGAIFAYGQLRRKVTEKAVERGMRTVTVPYHKSSRFCSKCGHEQHNAGRLRKNKERRKFICECGEQSSAPAARGRGQARGAAPAALGGCPCRNEINSDANAARVLAMVFWGRIRLPKPLPEDATRA